MGGQEEDHLVRNVGIAVVAVTALLAVAIIVLFERRDRWELLNAAQVSAKLNEAHRLQQSDPLTAYKIFDEVLQEARQHKITDARFSEKLASAEKSRTALYQKVENQLRLEEAEKQRRAEEEARRVAAEKQRVAEEQEQKRAAAEAQRIAEEERRAEEKRRKEAVSLYRNAPESARMTLNVLKKVEARTEVGITFADYSTVVGQAWAEVKIFIESPAGKSLPEFSVLLTRAVADFKLALDIWQKRIRWPTLYGDRTDVEAIQQFCWMRAGTRIKLAESLLDVKKTEKALESFAALAGNDVDLDAKWKKVEDDILKR